MSPSLFLCVSSGVIVLLSLAFLMPAFYYIPKASLAAVIICAVAPMVDYRVVVKMWRIRSRCCFVFVQCVSHVSVCLTLVSHSRVSRRAGPAAFCCDVPDEFLAGAVRHHRRYRCVWSPAAVQLGKTSDKGTVIFCRGLCVSECDTLRKRDIFIFSMPQTHVALFVFSEGSIVICLI